MRVFEGSRTRVLLEVQASEESCPMLRTYLALRYGDQWLPCAPPKQKWLAVSHSV